MVGDSFDFFVATFIRNRVRREREQEHAVSRRTMASKNFLRRAVGRASSVTAVVFTTDSLETTELPPMAAVQRQRGFKQDSGDSNIFPGDESDDSSDDAFTLGGGPGLFNNDNAPGVDQTPKNYQHPTSDFEDQSDRSDDESSSEPDDEEPPAAQLPPPRPQRSRRAEAVAARSRMPAPSEQPVRKQNKTSTANTGWIVVGVSLAVVVTMWVATKMLKKPRERQNV